MPWGVAAAAVAAGGAVYASSKQAKAAKKAGQAQTDAADSANQVQLDIFNQQREDQAPFRQAGLTGLNQYMKLLGLPTDGSGQYGGGISANAAGSTSNPFVSLDDQGVPTVNSALYQSDPAYKQAWDQAVAEHQAGFHKGYQADSSLSSINSRLNTLYSQFGGGKPAASSSTQTPAQAQQDAFAAFRATPGYQFGLDEGSKAVQASAAARGGLNSGAALKSLQKFGTDYADQQGYTPYANRLAALAGVAQTATNQIGQYGTNYASSVGNNLINAGNARAQGIYGSANSWANGAQQVAGAAGQYLGSQYNPGGSNATLSDGLWGGI